MRWTKIKYITILKKNNHHFTKLIQLIKIAIKFTFFCSSKKYLLIVEISYKNPYSLSSAMISEIFDFSVLLIIFFLWVLTV